MADVLAGTVVAVSSDPAHRFSKWVRPYVRLIENFGIEGDAHAGPFVKHRYDARRTPSQPNLRQVHMIQCELFSRIEGAWFRGAAGRTRRERHNAGSRSSPASADMPFASWSECRRRTYRSANALRLHRPVSKGAEARDDREKSRKEVSCGGARSGPARRQCCSRRPRGG